MAKKKAVKTAKKAAKKRASSGAAASGATEAVGAPTAETSSCTDQELQAAGLVATSGGLWVRFDDAILAALEARGVDVAELVRTAAANHQRGPASGRVLSDEKATRLLDQYRTDFQHHDQAVPYLRVVGKVVEVLTVHRAQRRRKDHCSGGEVFLVFLAEIPQHSPYAPADYRLSKPTRRGNVFDVTRDPGKNMIAGRLRELKDRGWLTPAGTTRSGGERGYRLSETGRTFFNGWPDVPGLQLDPPDEHE